jgi:hypothetical protein
MPERLPVLAILTNFLKGDQQSHRHATQTPIEPSFQELRDALEHCHSPLTASEKLDVLTNAPGSKPFSEINWDPAYPPYEDFK